MEVPFILLKIHLTGCQEKFPDMDILAPFGDNRFPEKFPLFKG
jgi:hypothetical protein